MLFEKAIDMFIDNCKALERSPKTIESYKNSLKKFDLFLSNQYNKPLYIDEVTPDDLDRFIFQNYNSAKYSTSTQHNAITAFRSLYSYLERKRLCENKGKLTNNIKVECKEREVISEVEFRRMIPHLKNPTPRAVVYTLYYAGLRISEALKLKLSDVDLEKDLLYIKETKNKIDRTVPINAKLKKILQTYLAAERKSCGTDNFFSTYPKGQICPSEVNKRLRKAVKNAGIGKKISAHNLRHSFASTLIQRGVDVVTVKTLMGHGKIRTTSVYCHTSLEELAEAVNLL